MLRDWFKSWKSKRPATSLSEAAAVEIAQKAAAAEFHDSHRLTMVNLVERSGRWIWIVSTPTVGSSLVVCIDDATGTVVEMSRHGVR